MILSISAVNHDKISGGVRVDDNDDVCGYIPLQCLYRKTIICTLKEGSYCFGVAPPAPTMQSTLDLCQGSGIRQLLCATG